MVVLVVLEGSPLRSGGHLLVICGPNPADQSAWVVVYDWTLLLIPAVILASQRIDLRDTWLGIGAIVALAANVSTQFAEAQLNSLGWAIQIAVPALVLGAIGVSRGLKAKPAA